MKLFLKMALSAVAALGVVWALIVLVEFFLQALGASELNVSDALGVATFVALFGLVIFTLPGLVCWYASYSLLAASALGPVRKLFISAGVAGAFCPLLLIIVFGGLNSQSLQELWPLVLVVLTVALLSAVCYWLLFMVWPKHKKLCRSD